MRNILENDQFKETHLNEDYKECTVSKASKEIMLVRISDGEDLGFPFKK